MISGHRIRELVQSAKIEKELASRMGSNLQFPDVSTDFRYLDIEPFNASNCNPHSYNLTLTNKLKVYNTALPLLTWYQEVRKHGAAIFSGNFPPLPQPLDPDKDNTTTEITIPESGYELFPGIVYLGATVEKMTTFGLAPEIDGRSSFGRLGLIVHLTAGYIDSGFSGHYTLELAVIQPKIIYPFRQICQVSYSPIEGRTQHYCGKYNGQVEPTASRSFQERPNQEEK